MSDQRSEQPTQRRRSEARRKGEGVGRSSELAMAMTLGAAMVALAAIVPAAAGTLAALVRESAMELAIPRPGPELLLGRLGDGLRTSITLVAPLGLVIAAAAIAANLAAGGPILSLHPLRFDLHRLDPIAGLKRILDRQALFRLGVAAVKVVLLGAAGYLVLAPRVPVLLGMQGADVAATGGTALDAGLQLGLTVTLALAAIALVDFVVQRRRALGQLKMTKDEVRRELKDTEGDPIIRSMRRRRARQLAFTRMMAAVPTADVVVTNPIHLAVALRYDSLSMDAPRIVAKGQRLVAERIKAIAQEHGVAVVRDIPLARALFPQPIGSAVPPELYRAVARILVVVQQARFGARRPSPAARTRPMLTEARP